jgi:hypothetical protein
VKPRIGNQVSETKDSWCTPQIILTTLTEFAGRVELDPCSNPNSIINANREWYGPPHGTCGLFTPWRTPFGYFNPPYSEGNKHIWTRKASNEYTSGRAKELIGLLPADTDTGWFHDNVVPTAGGICFWRGRLTFIGDKKQPAMFPVVLLYWGRRRARFAKVFGKHGWCPPMQALRAKARALAA